jgi:capsular exopolysaccharide synthesis family protein
MLASSGPQGPGEPSRPANQQPAAAAATAAVVDPVRILRAYWPWLAGAGVASGIFGVVLYFVLGYFVPRYQSFVMYQVLPPMDVMNPMAGQSAISFGGRDELDRYMETATQVIVSDLILQKALEQRQVEETKWSNEFRRNGQFVPSLALREFRDIVSAGVVPETSLFRMAVSTRSPLDAQILCTAVSDVFLRESLTVDTREAQSRIEDFDAKVETLNQEVRAISTRIDNIIITKKLTADREENSIWYQEVQELQRTLTEVRAQLASSQEQLSQFRAMLDAPTGTVYPEAIREEAEHSPVARELEIQIETNDALLRAARERYGDNHRQVMLQEQNNRALTEQRDRVIQRQTANIFAARIEDLERAVGSLGKQDTDLSARLENAQLKLNEITSAIEERDNLEAERDRKIASIKEFEDQMAIAQLTMQAGARIRPYSLPKIPDQRAFPKKVPVIGASMVLITGAVAGLIFLKEIREQRVRTPADLAAVPGTRVLGVVPDLALDPTMPERAETACLDRPTGVFADSVRQLRTTLLRTLRERRLKSVLFVAGMPGSGSTSVVANLGVNAASIELKVLLIDANMRRPTLHQVLGREEGPGLADVLRGEATLTDAIRATDVSNLSLLSAGSKREHAYERFNTSAMHDLLASAGERFDLVLIDCPPAIVAGDALSLTTQADAVVMVVRAYGEKRGLVARLRSQLSDSRAAFLGVVVNGVKSSAGGYFKQNFQAAVEYQGGVIGANGIPEVAVEATESTAPENKA